LVRGVYAKRDLPEGHILTDDDVYLAIPLQKGQVSCRELMRGEVLITSILQDEPITINAIDSPYASIPSLRDLIYGRGLDETKQIRQTSPEFREMPSLSKSA
jgi:N-acetylneuraminate synthase